MQPHAQSLTKIQNLCDRIQGGRMYGEPERAKQAILEAIRTNPESPDLAELYYNLGLVYLDVDLPKNLWEEVYGDTLASFRKAAELSPGHIKAHENAALILDGQNRFEEAIIHAQAALKRAKEISDERGIRFGNSLVGLLKRKIDAQSTEHPWCSAEHPQPAGQS